MIRFLVMITFLVGLSACSSQVVPSLTPEKTLGLGAPLVYAGEYIGAGSWCSIFDIGTAQEHCEGMPAALGIESRDKQVMLLRQEGLMGAPKIVPYDESQDLCKDSDVCSPNYVVHAYGEVTPWGMISSKISEVWQYKNESNIIVAVIDTGIDCNHPELKGNCVKGYNAITDTEDTEGNQASWDDAGHGTHVAGTIGASHNNSGLRGSISRVSLLPVKFLGSSGGGSMYNAIRALDWARNAGSKVQNLSWGCKNCFSAPLLEALKRGQNDGVLYVAAAGNSKVNNDSLPHYPSSYNLSNIISVSACTPQSNLSYFSNYGASTVDLCAPGSNVKSTIPGGGFKSLSGTSMAAPHVAGVAALIGQDARERILSTVRKVGGLSGKVATGGVLDALAAYKQQSVGPPIVSCKKKKMKRCWRRKCNRLRYRGYKRWTRCRRKCRKTYNC